MGDAIRMHVFVSGRVQGVGFRYWTEQQALSRGLRGWVRNVPDGRVEAVLEGEREEVLAMVKAMEDGPAAARVDSCCGKEYPAEGEFSGFSVRRT